MAYQCLFQLWYVHVERFVHLLKVQQRCALNTVQKLSASVTDFVLLEIPIKEHPGRDDPFIVRVTVETIIVSVEFAELGQAKDWGGGGVGEGGGMKGYRWRKGRVRRYRLTDSNRSVAASAKVVL